VAVHCVETTEPSVLAHEILTARPYAFLDDAELQDRRTNAVTLRRGLAVDLTAIGALEPAAIERVRVEVAPEPTSDDDLHDLLCSVVVTPARTSGAPSGTSCPLGDAGRSSSTAARNCGARRAAGDGRAGARR